MPICTGNTKLVQKCSNLQLTKTLFKHSCEHYLLPPPNPKILRNLLLLNWKRLFTIVEHIGFDSILSEINSQHCQQGFCTEDQQTEQWLSALTLALSKNPQSTKVPILLKARRIKQKLKHHQSSAHKTA